MRILVLHSRYLSGSLSGENRVVDEEVELLRSGGHDVTVFAPLPDQFSAPALAARTLGFAGVARSLYDHIRRDQVDLVHCHNLYPTLGAGVLTAASNAGAAVVLTLHNFRLSCVAGTFFRDGRVCQDCLGRPRWPGIVHGCYRGSHVQSAVLSTALATARARGAFESVHRFLAVSAFIRQKHVEAGYPPDRILVKPNVVPPQMRREGPGTYFLALSRLSVEKGISQIVSAWQADLGELRIVGDGPERPEIERLAKGRGGVRLEGGVDPDAIPSLLSEARALLLPSLWFEGQPRVILEAYAAGVPVIASRIGGLAEAVIDHETGITVDPEDPNAWRAAVRELSDDGLSIRLGQAAHALWRDRFSQDRGLALLEAAYGEALEEKAAGGGGGAKL